MAIRETGDSLTGSTEDALREHLRLEAHRLGIDSEEVRVRESSYVFLERALSLIRSRLFAFILFVSVVFLGVFVVAFLSDQKLPAKQLPILLYGVTSLLAMLALVLTLRWVDVFYSKRRGTAGSEVQLHFALILSALTAVPIVIVSIFSVLFFEMGVDSRFSENVSQAIESSSEVARAYTEDRENRIGVSVLEMARRIELEGAGTDETISELLTFSKFDEGIVFLLEPTGDRKVIARSGVTFLLENEEIDPQALTNAKAGEPVIFSDLDKKRVLALVRLNDPKQLFLYGVDYLEESAVEFVLKTEEASESYMVLRESQETIKITLILGFGAFALLLVMSSVWLGLNFSRWLVFPLSKLITATNMVSQGNLSVHVREDVQMPDEIRNLIKAFNYMTRQLYEQHHALIINNQELEARQKLIEGVLSGVSAGVMGVDIEGRICLSNQRASEILGQSLENEKSLSEIGGELNDFMKEVLHHLHFSKEEQFGRYWEKEVKIKQGLDEKILQVRVFLASEEENKSTKEGVALVVTIDEITGLIFAQRQAAWSDVARRIAHEIKNPLTPIQLSAERLQRRYGSKLKEGQEIFQECVQTIIDKVDMIRVMVDEFSSFSRMPRPVCKPKSMIDIVRQAVFLQSHADKFNKYNIEIDSPCDDVVWVDERLLGQVITNLLLNSCASIEKRREQDGEDFLGKVMIRIRDDNKNDTLEVEIEDNGSGWDHRISDGNLDRFFDPYITSNKRDNSGLGLSIVKRIISQHNGRIELTGLENGEGAKVLLIFVRGEIKIAKEDTV